MLLLVLLRQACARLQQQGQDRTIDGDSSGKPAQVEDLRLLSSAKPLCSFHSASRLAALDFPHRQPDSLPHFPLPSCVGSDAHVVPWSHLLRRRA